jgi:hypothetical protein
LFFLAVFQQTGNAADSLRVPPVPVVDIVVDVSARQHLVDALDDVNAFGIQLFEIAVIFNLHLSLLVTLLLLLLSLDVCKLG